MISYSLLLLSFPSPQTYETLGDLSSIIIFDEYPIPSPEPNNQLNASFLILTQNTLQALPSPAAPYIKREIDERQDKIISVDSFTDSYTEMVDSVIYSQPPRLGLSLGFDHEYSITDSDTNMNGSNSQESYLHAIQCNALNKTMNFIFKILNHSLIHFPNDFCQMKLNNYIMKIFETVRCASSYSMIQYDPKFIEHLINQNIYMIIGEIIFIKIFFLLIIFVAVTNFFCKNTDRKPKNGDKMHPV